MNKLDDYFNSIYLHLLIVNGVEHNRKNPNAELKKCLEYLNEDRFRGYVLNLYINETKTLLDVPTDPNLNTIHPWNPAKIKRERLDALALVQFEHFYRNQDKTLIGFEPNLSLERRAVHSLCLYLLSYHPQGSLEKWFPTYEELGKTYRRFLSIDGATTKVEDFFEPMLGTPLSLLSASAKVEESDLTMHQRYHSQQWQISNKTATLWFAQWHPEACALIAKIVNTEGVAHFSDVYDRAIVFGLSVDLSKDSKDLDNLFVFWKAAVLAKLLLLGQGFAPSFIQAPEKLHYADLPLLVYCLFGEKK